MTLRFSVPVPPSVNHSYRRYTNKRGRTMNVLTNKAKTWQEEAHVIAQDAANRTGWVCPMGSKVVVRLWFYWPDKRRRDPNNCHKLLADSLEGVCYDDDKWALLRDMDFTVDRDKPRVEVEVERA